MISQLLFATFLYVTVRCLENNNTKYCVVNSGDPGIIIVDPIASKDISFIDIPSMFVDNTTKLFNFTEKTKVYNNWNVLCSVENLTHVNEPVLDQRWENFTNNNEHGYDFQSILETTKTSVFLSVRIFNTSVDLRMKEGEWNHLLLAENKTLYACNGVLLENCTEELNNGNQSVVDYYVNSSILKSIWKLHKYYYLYTTTQATETIYENKYNCTDIQTGCIFIYLTMCKECDINLQLNSSATNVTRIIRKGNGTWVKENISLENFTSCFSLTVTTEATNNTEDTNNDELFWALGDIGYLSTTQNCKDIKRYTTVDMSDTMNSNLICENTFNQNIDFVFELPKEEQKSDDVVNETHQSPELSSFNPLYLLIIIPVVLIIVALATFWYIYIRKQKDKNGSKLTNDDDVELLKRSDEAAALPDRDNWPAIKSGDFASYVREAFDPNRKHDYLRIQFSKLPSGYLKLCEVGKNPENLHKNRYVKIYPYDENRVKLERSLGDVDHSDYINASYVQGYDNPTEYIVTQNPLKNTAADFFRMIWQETVEYIVMISNNDEEFFCYWPNPKTSVAHGDIEVGLDEIHSYEFYDHRLLKIRRFGQEREVNQLHFHAWSNEMLSSHIFLDFMNHLLKVPHGSSPVVFHCLAGVGRSATILLCDMALRISAISGSVNLFGITKQLRGCRADMVQNLRQYQLAHLIVFESLNYKDTSVPINEDFQAHFSRLFEGNIMKKMWSEYLENTEWLYEAITPYVICAEYPKRNRYIDNNLLPVQHSRVALQYRQPDYIHAMFVNDFNQQKNVIVAQQPMRSTLSDFWIMLLQNQVQTIINLNEPDFGSDQFFPTQKEMFIKVKGNITIEFVDEEQNFYYDKLELAVCCKGQNEKRISLLNVKGWQKIKAVPESTDIMTSIWDITKTKTQNFPILICCDDGISSSSLVACFFYMTDKILQLHKCDVVGAVRAVRRSHTNFINFEQFVFLHHCALAFYRNFYKQYESI